MSRVQLNYDEGIKALSPTLETKLTRNMEQTLAHIEGKTGLVNVLFCSKGRIQELNREFRQMDKPTDILSWQSEEEAIPGIISEEMPWGELAVCLEVCQNQAEQSGRELDAELHRLLIHGLVHLAGYDHETAEAEKIMIQIETDLLSRIGLGDIY